MLRALLSFCLASWVAAVPAEGGRWNVIIVVLDAVRADHTSAYGYARGTTPALAELAGKGVLFETAWAQSDWTLPAFASLLTGRRPAAHGVFMLRDRLGPVPVTLAEAFRSRGFKTAAFTAAIIAAPGYGLDRGFDVARGFDAGETPVSLDVALPAATAWLGANHKAPFFLLIHGSDAHYPYSCPPEQRDRFLSGAPAASPAISVDKGFVRSFNLPAGSLLEWWRASRASLRRAEAVRSDPAALARIAAQYDGCLGYGDSVLPVLYEAMDRFGLWDDTILIVTADHGEELGDHGGWGHMTRPLYEAVLRVPLVVYDPLRAAAGQRVKAAAEQIDIFPTLMSMEGWDIPAGVEGRSLAVRPGRQTRIADEALPYAQACSRPEGVKRLDLEAFRDGDWKVVRRGDSWELFDLAADPQERRNLLPERPEVFLRIAAKILRLKTKP